MILALLGSLIDFAVSISKPKRENGERLVVHIKKVEGENRSDLMTGDQVIRSTAREEITSVEFAEHQQEIASVDTSEPATDAPPVKNWRGIADEAIKSSIDEYFAQEESRASMWRQSRSIMFQPTSKIVVNDKEPIISDFRFKPRVHVAGLGVTIGSCFIGIPIVGVPVRQRTVAIRLFVCAEKSG